MSDFVYDTKLASSVAKDASMEARHWIVALAEDRDRLQSDLTAAKAEIERLRGRVAELEEFAADAQKDAWRALDPDYVPPDVERAMKTLLHRAAVITGEIDPDDIEPSPWLLRKQAEAVEDFADNRVRCKSAAKVYAQSLRTQAEAAEKGGDDD